MIGLLQLRCVPIAVHTASHVLASFHRFIPNKPAMLTHAALRTVCQMRHLHSSRVTCGVMDSLRGAYDSALTNNEARTERKVFDTQMKYLTAPERLNPNVYLNLMRDIKAAAGLSGFREHLPWMASNPALGEFKDQEKILSALTDDEKKDVRKVKIAARKRLARDTGLGLREVEALIGQVQLTGWMQIVVRRRMKEGKTVDSPSQLQTIMRQSGSGGINRHRNRFPNPGIKRKDQRRRQ